MTDLTISIFLSVIGRLMSVVSLIVFSVLTTGSSTTASRIIRSFSVPTQNLRSLRLTPEKHLHLKGQMLRLYNPDSHQWSIYLLDLDKGVLSVPPVVGEFNGNRGEFYDQEQYKGRAVLVRHVWLNISPKSARMEQSFSADGRKNVGN